MVWWSSSDIQSVTVNYWRTLFGTVSIAAITRERSSKKKWCICPRLSIDISAHLFEREFYGFGKDEYLWQSDSEHWELLLVLTKNWKSVCHIFGLFFDRVNVSDRYFWIVYLCYTKSEGKTNVFELMKSYISARHKQSIDRLQMGIAKYIDLYEWYVRTAIRLSGDCQLHMYRCTCISVLRCEVRLKKA